MDNTLDDLLPDLRRLLPASLRGAYLDGYVRRKRTPMELLLSRSLPDTHPTASTFEDVKSEIRVLQLPLRETNKYLGEIEQALAVGDDTREVLSRATAFAAVLQLVRGMGAYFQGSGHRLAEGQTDEAVATRLWDAGFRAHMDLVPANVKIVKMNRGGSGSITAGAPPASAVRGNIYTSPAEIRGAITAYGAASRR